MSAKKLSLPPCGLYRTGRPLKSQPDAIPAGILVMFHNHSNRNIPMLQLPKENTHNVWTFQEEGPGIEDDDAFLKALKPLREQGFYFLREDIQTPDGRLPKGSLVQLGYNRNADPIFFIARRGQDTNSLLFAETGYRFENLSVLEKLAPSEPLWFIGRPAPAHTDENQEEPNAGGMLN